MRLLKLQIKNFISIKQATVDFDDLNDGVFLISGPTGSGKSSLLDAVHWVLFGKTLSSNRASVTKEIRSTYAPAGEDTVVTLTFNQDKIDYRVTRMLKRDGSSAIQLHTPGIIYDKIKEANDQLEKIIGLTVKQFDQMVMLEQGNFSKFLLADSKTRAEILRDIFDTQLFKDIEIRFKDRCNNLKNTILNSTELEQNLLHGELLESIESAITLTAETITEERARLDELKSKHDQAQAMLPELVTFDQAYAVYKKAQDELALLNNLKAEVTELYRKRDVYNNYVGIVDWYNQHQKIVQELTKNQESAKDYQNRIARVIVDDELSDRVKALQERQNYLKNLITTFENIERYQSQIGNYEAEVAAQAQERQTLQTTLDNIIEQKDTLKVRIDNRREYDQNREAVLHRDKERTRIQSEIDSLTDFIESNKATYRRLLADKLVDMSEDGICPICGAPYTAEHDELIQADGLDEKQRELETKKNQLEGLKLQLEGLPPLPEPDCIEAVPYSTLTANWNDITKKYQEIEAQIADLDKKMQVNAGSMKIATEELDRLLPTVAGLTKAATSAELGQVQTEYHELWAKVDDNEMAKRSRNLLEGYLKGVQDKIEELQNRYNESLRSPDARDEDSAELKEALANAAAVHDYRVHINEYLYKIQQFEMLRDNLMSVTEPINPHPGFTAASCQQLITDTNIGIEEAIRKISDAQNSLDARKALVKQVHELRAEREKKIAEYEMHTYLHNLLSGKNASRISFETFVLHRQLEWILQSSNQYLHTLSAGQFELQVRWESTSNRTQGGLEITITDHFTGSTRPAQTFSGGELFMLSLSLSLGLMTAIDSLFTARDLNLLFVDEGFGTLDRDCLSRTLMTLRDLKNIKSVGIISHVQDLIDTIPQGFIVEKTATGSRIKPFKNI